MLNRRAVLVAAGTGATLMMAPENPVVGGTVLRRAAIQSPNFVTGSTGWTIKQDGSAEFNNVVIRGGQIVSGTALFYSSSPPAFGTLIASVAATGGTDSSGNAYLQGSTTYLTPFPGGAAGSVLAQQDQGGQTTWWSAATFAGPYTAIVTESIDASSDWQVRTQAAPVTTLSLLTAGGALINGTLSGVSLLSITNTGANTAPEVLLTMGSSTDPALDAKVNGDTTPRYRFLVTGQTNWGPGNAVHDAELARLSANRMGFNLCDLAVHTAGRGLQVAEGTNAKAGTAVLAAGSKLVATTAVTASSRIGVFCQTLGTVTVASTYDTTTRVVGTSFTIHASQGTDTSTVYWIIFEPG